MNNIIVLNAYGMKNLGDGTISSVALRMIDQTLKGTGKINVMFADSKEEIRNYTSKSKIEKIVSPYGHAIETNGKTLSTFKKMSRFTEILIGSVFWTTIGTVAPAFLPRSGKYAYITAIKNSNAAIGMGGGYIRTKEKYKDFFGLILTVLPIYISKVYRKKVLFLPMSFGNFASGIHEKISYHALSGTTVLSRDDISYKLLDKFNKNSNNKIENIFSPDLALYFNTLKYINLSEKINSNYIVLTARKWMDQEKQQRYEDMLSKFIDYVWEKYKLKTYFVAMASNSIEDDDREVAKSIGKKLTHKNIFKIVNTKTPEDVQKILNKAKAAVCTRMHSAILSSTVFTPFITIGYEYKTLGFMEYHNLKDWHTEIQTVTLKELTKKFDNLLKKANYLSFIEKVKLGHQKSAKYESKILKQIHKVIT